MTIPVDSKGPYVKMTVDGKDAKFLIDTGATNTSISHRLLPNAPLSGTYDRSVGYSNDVVTAPISKPLDFTIGPLTGEMPFVLTDKCSLNLLGMKALRTMYALIYCTPDGVYLTCKKDVFGKAFAIQAAPSLPSELLDIDPELWAKGPNDAGCMNIDPVQIKMKSNAVLPRIPQYKISKEGEEGLKDVISDLLEKKIIRKVSGNVCNSPVLPVVKRDDGSSKVKYRMCVDLRAVNKIVEPQYPVVPDITAMFSSIPPNAKYFTVIDLKNAFFSIPIHPDSQFIFGFAFQGQSYVFCIAPQGYTESPSIYSKALKKQ